MAEDDKSAALPPSLIRYGEQIYNRAVNPGLARRFHPLGRIVDLPPGRLAASILRRWTRSGAFCGSSFVWLRRRLRSSGMQSVEHAPDLPFPFQSSTGAQDLSVTEPRAARSTEFPLFSQARPLGAKTPVVMRALSALSPALSGLV